MGMDAHNLTGNTMPTIEQLLDCLHQSIRYKSDDTHNHIIRRAAYYAGIACYTRTLTEKHPLDAHRAVHYGLPIGSYRQYTVVKITDREKASLLWAVRKVYNEYFKTGVTGNE